MIEQAIGLDLHIVSFDAPSQPKSAEDEESQ